MKIHPRVALGTKLVIAALPLWIASHVVYLTVMGIFGSSDNAGVWFLGGIVLLLQALVTGLLAFALVTGLWQSPSEILRQLKHDWWQVDSQGHTLDLHAMSSTGESEFFMDEENSPHVIMNPGQ